VTSLYPLGGIFAVLYLGWAIDRFGARRSLAVHYAVGIVFIALISLVAMPYFALLIVVLLAGVTVLGSQTGLDGACGKLYPARMRTSGYGFATGVGRLGGIAAGPLGGVLLAKGLPPTYVFLSACVFAAMAAIATAFLALPERRAYARSRPPRQIVPHRHRLLSCAGHSRRGFPRAARAQRSSRTARGSARGSTGVKTAACVLYPGRSPQLGLMGARVFGTLSERLHPQ
jgi:MFS family permease